MDFNTDQNLNLRLVGAVSYAEAVGSFSDAEFEERFGESFERYLPVLEKLGYIEDIDGRWSYIPPPGKSAIPAEFKRMYELWPNEYAGCKKGVTAAWNIFKKHKDHKQQLHRLVPAVEALIAARDQDRRAGNFVPQLRNLLTWLGPQRGWEDVVDKNILPQQHTDERYAKWILMKYGPTAKPVLSNGEISAYRNGTGAFSGINSRMSKQNQVYYLEKVHSEYYAGVIPGKKSPFDRLVELFNAAIQ